MLSWLFSAARFEGIAAIQDLTSPHRGGARRLFALSTGGIFVAGKAEAE